MSLTTNYLGLELKNPIVASSSPLSHSLDGIRRLEDAGASAVVMYSLGLRFVTKSRLFTYEETQNLVETHLGELAKARA